MYTVERWSSGMDVFAPPSASKAICEWTILQTKPRHEKLLVAELSDAGIFCYLPLVRKMQSYGGRRIEATIPLFSQYVFLHGSADDVSDAFRTRRVGKIIHVPDQMQIDWELRNLRRALSGPHTLEPHPCIKSCVKATLRSGALRGLEGFVEDGGNMNRLILQIGMLGQAVSLEIGASDVLSES